MYMNLRCDNNVEPDVVTLGVQGISKIRFSVYCSGNSWYTKIVVVISSISGSLAV